MSVTWVQFKWKTELVPLQNVGCLLIGIEVTCTDAIRHMELLQATIGDLVHFKAISDAVLQIIKNRLDDQVVLIVAFFRVGFETHHQFFSEEARGIADRFGRIPAAGIARQLVMLEIEAADFDRVCEFIHPTILERSPFA